MGSEVTCQHGTLLAAWCADCANEWLPETVAPAVAELGQSAA